MDQSKAYFYGLCKLHYRKKINTRRDQTLSTLIYQYLFQQKAQKTLTKGSQKILKKAL